MRTHRKATIGRGRRRLVALCLALGLCPLLLLSVTAISLTRSSITRAVNARMLASAEQNAAYVRQQLTNIQSGSQTRARRPALSAALKDGNPTAFDRFVVDAQLLQFLSARQDISGAYLVDLGGSVVRASARDGAERAELHPGLWLDAAAATTSGVVSPAFITNRRGGATPGVVVATAVRTATPDDTPGSVLGYLAVLYRLDNLVAYLQDYAKTEQLAVTVTDQRGQVVIEVGSSRRALSSLSGDGRVAQALRGRSANGDAETKAGRFMSGAAPVQSFGWAALVEVNAGAALADMGRLTTTELAVTALLACLLLGGLFIFNRSLAVRELMETELVDSEERYRSVYDRAPVGIARLGLDGLFLDANPTLGRMLESSPGSLSGRTLQDLLGKESRESGEAFSELRAGRADTRVWEERFERRDGSTWPGLVTLSLVRDSEDQPQYLIGTLEDMSQRVEAEAARRESQAKTRFLAAMSHELRTPLNSILGYSQLLTGGDYGPLNERQSRYVGHIEMSGRHLLALINDLLNISRIQSGETQLELVDVDVAAVIAGAVDSIAPLARQKGLKLAGRRAAPVRALADERALRQVVLNLLSNAIKFTPEGGRVTVGATSAGGTVTITVADTGIGIPPDQCERIFQEFTQVESGLSRSQDGSGLGLALCRNLARLMNGDVAVQSRVGMGSRFSVTLPAPGARARRTRMIVAPSGA